MKHRTQILPVRCIMVEDVIVKYSDMKIQGLANASERPQVAEPASASKRTRRTSESYGNTKCI
jgi:hypothetical protein